MRALISNELYKMIRQSRIWITFGVLAIIMALINFGIKLEGETMFDLLLQSFKSQFAIEGNFINGYLIAYIAFNTLWIHIPILLIVVTADMLSGELESGTIRNLLCSPVSRTKVLFSKVVAALVYVVTFMIFMGLTGILPAILLFGKGDILVFFSGVQIILAEEAPVRFGMALLFGTLSMITFVSISFMFSVLLRNTLAAILASLGLLIVSTLLHSFVLDVFASWKPFLFTYHMTQWQLFFINDIPYDEVWDAALVLIIYTIVAMMVTFFRFNRIQITE